MFHICANSCMPDQYVMGAISFPSGETLKAVLFDIDGTLCDSDPLHYLAFRDMLQEVCILPFEFYDSEKPKLYDIGM